MPFLFQTVTHLKMLLHFAVGILLGLLFSNMGVDGSKIINNIGFFMSSLVYLSYTSLIPAILKCNYRQLGLR
jgi:hypothetical protein